jgi:tRNA (adenine22-N1)-methyltransferase
MNDRSAHLAYKNDILVHVMLDSRLLAVAHEVRCHRHIDIGSDHGYLPTYLLESGRICHAIVVEINQGPFELARRTLAGLRAEVLLGDGLEPIDVALAASIDSLSITGMGVKLIIEILDRYPDKLPSRIIVQPNDNAEPLRRWALGKFHILNEQMVKGFSHYEILTLQKSAEVDPSYLQIASNIALRFGPLLLKSADPILLDYLTQQFQRLSGLPKTPRVVNDLDVVQQALTQIRRDATTEI